jgi:hypothetical protein
MKLQRKHHEAVAKILADAAQTLHDHPKLPAETVRRIIADDLERWLASEDPTFDVMRFRRGARNTI